ncbi:prepilin peptidase [Schnuerera sp. xch1]|uniref:prepilin peptidase n=1 Tax=Schnuerera sp. xch1 TaxID=2874283 RepID=UPI001CBCB411|nr:A24 family peptidase [Schnuerera sp. xch1]MBZ2173730.1 prepilin peptidase [Schnuerera sp. xch1]
MEILIFLIGIIIGYFLNVCIYRILKNESIVFPGFHCSNCSTPLNWYDLVPIISFLSLRRKCIYCGMKISLRYPFAEILNGIIFLALYYKFGFSTDFIFYSILFSIFILITLIDINYHIIPNMLIYIILLESISYCFIKYFLHNGQLNLLGNLGGLVLSGIIFLIIFIVSNGGMGGGDVKLIAVLGFILGMPKIILGIFLSFLLGGIISVLLLVLKIKERKDAIPFGPFIILAFVITLFWGDKIMKWYLKSFLR